MFHVIEKELRWRRDNGRPEGFGTLKRYKPLVAVGAEKPSGDQIMMADYFRTSILHQSPGGLPGGLLLTR